jgi:hypothetical protein
MDDRPVGASVMQEARRGPIGCGRLRDEFCRKVKVEFVGTHRFLIADFGLPVGP